MRRKSPRKGSLYLFSAFLAQSLQTLMIMRARYFTTMASSYEHFFRHTSGRWIHDQERQLAMRYRRFDVDALKSRVLAATGADGVEDVQKLDEGRCNKVFRVKLQNSRDVIARIPTPLVGPAHIVTASEVATMDFLRNRLKLHQVPRVLSSSSRASDTPVGAEYIIMDSVDGVALRDVWNDLTMHQKISLVDKWIKFESVVVKAMRMCGGVYGSLYYRKDLPSADTRDIFVDGVKDDEFVIGPCVLSLFWEKEDNFDTLDFDRGSCALFIRIRQPTVLTVHRGRRPIFPSLAFSRCTRLDQAIRSAYEVCHPVRLALALAAARRASTTPRPV